MLAARHTEACGDIPGSRPVLGVPPSANVSESAPNLKRTRSEPAANCNGKTTNQIGKTTGLQANATGTQPGRSEEGVKMRKRRTLLGFPPLSFVAVAGAFSTSREKSLRKG